MPIQSKDVAFCNLNFENGGKLNFQNAISFE